MSGYKKIYDFLLPELAEELETVAIRYIDKNDLVDDGGPLFRIEVARQKVAEAVVEVIVELVEKRLDGPDPVDHISEADGLSK